MALIKCPDCGREVSDRASSCPQCASPLAAATVMNVPVMNVPAVPSGAPQVQTIERTGKRFKGLHVLGVLGVCFGVFVLILGGAAHSSGATTLGGLSFLGGLGAYLYARIGAWWSHG